MERSGAQGPFRGKGFDDTEPLTDPHYWERKRARLVPTPDYTFHDLLARLLPRDSNKRLIEVGCAPGNFLLYFAREFGYRISGIDWIPHLNLLRSMLEERGASVEELYESDFLRFEIEKQYDIAASFGFLEHFTDSKRVAKKQLELVAPGGFLIIEVPHFKGFVGHVRRVLDPEAFLYHNLELMDPITIRQLVEEEGFEVIYCDYFRTFGFWGGRTTASRIVAVPSFAISKTLKILHLDQIPNRHLSPYVVCIARKTQSS